VEGAWAAAGAHEASGVTAGAWRAETPRWLKGRRELVGLGGAAAAAEAAAALR
jgi:hypothetical protein